MFKFRITHQQTSMPALPDFASPSGFIFLMVSFFLIVTGRYLVIAGLFQIVFYNWMGQQWQSRRLGKKQVGRAQFLKEVKWSLVTSLIFSVIGAATALLWQKGFTRIYFSVADFGWWYLPVSLIISLLVHETYYYWLHRWMHRPAVFKILHKVHHDSSTTSPWTAFSFHPLEGLLQAIILPITILILPMHIYVLLIQLIIMTFSSVINHLEVEIYPNGFNRHIVGKWLIGATHHSMHHKQFKYNFGLHFTFWDKWKSTESPAFDKLYDEKTTKQKSQR